MKPVCGEKAGEGVIDVISSEARNLNPRRAGKISRRFAPRNDKWSGASPETAVIAVCCLILLGCQPKEKVETIAKALTCNCPKVVVQGIIENKSASYFASPKFVLKDSTAEVEVRAWLPLEVAPYHPDVVEEMKRRGEKWPPETMAAYLGVPLTVWGRIDGNVLAVDHAEHAK